MLLYLLFPIIVLGIDYAVYKSYQGNGGTLTNVWLAAVGIGILAIGLVFLVAPSISTYAPQTIQTQSGNIVIQSYNVTNTQSKATLSYALLLGELIIFIQLAYMLLMLLAVFATWRKGRYE